MTTPSSERSLRPVWIALAVLAGLVGVGFAVRGAARRLLVVAYTPDYRQTAAAQRPAGNPAPRGSVRWVQVASGLSKPTGLVFVPGGKGLAVALEQGGKARLVDLSGAAAARPAVATPGATVLDVPVNTDSEMGLLGLAFHPKWRENGRFFVDSNPAGGALRTHVTEYVVRDAELGKTPAHDARLVLEVAQPYGNHKGGQLLFGADGFLYIGLGDGGWRYDPHGNGQSLGTLLGKILRIDVDDRAASAYGIPKDNPFVGVKGARPEIWAYGLRNPWRFSFEPEGRIVVGDVGQDRFEEVDLVRRGENLGWNVREATHCFEPKEGCRTEGLVDPIYEYGREAGSCITGGFVYQGKSVPELAGKYVFADFVSGTLWALKLPGAFLQTTGLVEAKELGKFPLLISSFGRDEDGEIYGVDYGGGGVYRLAAGG
ncbi:MAG TPA: PQQ-dependent sugar dehydrogenase [Polyangiaceae bacterium]|nr:PQQ-dependent sugar dehydrogenase [Polyangiaceae bacterium]